MSAYVSVASQVRDAQTAIARLEQEILRHPEEQSLITNLAARKKKAARLLEQLQNVSHAEQIELCNYRIVSELSDRFYLHQVASSLGEYQNVFSQVFDGLINGPKSQAKFSEAVKQESALEFAFTYSGSLGVILLAPSARDFFEGKFDRTIESLYQLLDVEDAYSVRDVAKVLGGAVVKRLYDWSQANAKGGLDVDLQWQRSDGRYFGRIYRRRDAERVIAVIESTSDEEDLPVSQRGMLIGGDLFSRAFHFVVPNGESYRGKLAEDFPSDASLELGKTYDAVMTEYNKTHYAKDEVSSRYELNKLTPISSS